MCCEQQLCVSDTYLYLAVVTDGFDRQGGADGAVWAAWLQLDDVLGPPHQTNHRATVLKELLLLILGTDGERKTQRE